MADNTSKSEGSVQGRYYVDKTCIDCGLCSDTAPKHFANNSSSYMAFVQLQPANDSETALCEEALDGCPVGAIGSDGDE